MDYNIPSIETVYRGNHFRSRNEATWAAFFDLIGWSWEYEPIDLNGWIPDFSIRQKDDSSILAEVWWQSAQLCAKNVYGLGFVPEYGSWKPRISGAPYDGDNCGFLDREQGEKYISLFGDAKKKTRWEK